MSDVARALTDTLLHITSVPSFIGEERELCNVLELRFSRTLGSHTIKRHRDSLVVHAASHPGKPRIALVGHLDTVRSSHDGPARVEGDRLYGAGAADMKSGLAVMIELAERLDLDALACDLTLVFYEREEGPYSENVLGELLDQYPELRTLDLAICLEPSDNKLQLGCMGSLQATVTFNGRTAHSARPWQGENAIYKSIPFLQRLSELQPREHLIDGLVYKEVLSPTLAKAGRSRNIIPDVFELNVNYRFAPGKSVETAVSELRDLTGSTADVQVADSAPAAMPHRSDPLVHHLVECGVRGVEPKQAWTDVGRFDQIGVAAINFGPGTQAQAHQRNEWTEIPLLEEGYNILHRFLTTIKL
jgi:succinyl-diaminopimelate desuccinylase